ncbi:MAG TPA: acyltransferase [Phnomibacter sp.]|nr:acyltransferase [Phnomibacter sp.]
MKNLTNQLPNRYKWVDYARGISILLVVYRHVFEGLKRNGANAADYSFLETMNLFFFSFRMPLFFVIAGFFVQAGFAKRGIGGYVKHRAATILYPFVLWGFVQITLQLLFSGVTNSQRSAVDYLNLFIFPREIDQFWYLLALFNVSALYVIVTSTLKLKNNQQLMVGIFLYLLGMLVDYFGWSIGFAYDILHYYIFLAVGEFVSEFLFKRETLEKMSSTKYVAFGLPLFVAAQYLFLNINQRHNSFIYVEKYLSVLFLFIALVGVFYMLCLSMFLARTFKESWLSFIGRHSLQIYVLHVIVSSACRTVLVKFLGINSFPLLLVLCITVAVIVPVIIEMAANKLGMHYLFSLAKYEKKDSAVQQNKGVQEMSQSLQS